MLSARATLAEGRAARARARRSPSKPTRSCPPTSIHGTLCRCRPRARFLAVSSSSLFDVLLAARARRRSSRGRPGLRRALRQQLPGHPRQRLAIEVTGAAPSNSTSARAVGKDMTEPTPHGRGARAPANRVNLKGRGCAGPRPCSSRTGLSLRVKDPPGPCRVASSCELSSKSIRPARFGRRAGPGLAVGLNVTRPIASLTFRTRKRGARAAPTNPLVEPADRPLHVGPRGEPTLFPSPSLAPSE